MHIVKQTLHLSLPSLSPRETVGDEGDGLGRSILHIEEGMLRGNVLPAGLEH